MTTFIIPDYTIGNSADCQVQAIGVLQGLDQALQSLQPAPNATTVKFNNTVRCDAGATFITDMTPTQITQTETAIGTLYYTPTQFVQANSNVPTPIPASTTPYHRVILESSPVPLIDTLDPLTYTIVPETFNTYSYDSGYMYIGCESGNVYWFDTSTDTWTLQATFDGAVKCIYWHSPTGKLYIGGDFNNVSFPIIQTGLNYVCYITGLPTFNTIGVDVWNNYGVNGFDKQVNAIVGDNDNMYFGGNFQQNSNGTLGCKFIATYNWSSTGDLYALDNNSGNGFDNNVWSLALISFFLCVAGEFANIQTNSGSSSAQYCCQLSISGTTFTVAQVDFLYGTSIALSNPISSTEKVQTDGSNFYISTNDSNINGAGQNYFIGTGLGNSFPSVFQVGNNEALVQQQFTLQGGISSVGSDNIYLQGNNFVASLLFSSYLYWNSFYSRIEFIDLSTGTIYAFIGSTANQFTFSGGRGIIYNGTSYITGFNFPISGQGYTAELLYGISGNYYALISNTGNGTPFN